MLSVWERTSRAVPGHEVMPMTTMMLIREAPSTVARTIASGRNGITRNQSVNRLSTRPNPPRKYPDMIPITVPINIDMTVAASPTTRLIRAPHTIRARIERPLSSVPSGNPAVGGLIGSPVAWVTLIVLAGNSTGANSARAMKIARTTRPSIPPRWDRNARQVRVREARRRVRVTCRAEVGLTGSNPGRVIVIRHAPAGRARRT